MERRNFVIGLGGIAASAGLVAGSGAFSQVSADRDMTVAVADDSQAFLSLTAGSGEGEFVDETANTIALTFESLNTATGVNDNAISSFDNLIKINNHSNSVVDIGYTITGTASDGISLYTAAGDLAAESLEANGSTDADGAATDVLEFGAEIDTATVDFQASEVYTITLTATDNTTA